MFSGLSWWQVVLVLVPLTLAGIGGALGGLAGGAAAAANTALARRRRHGAALTALSMICVNALACAAYFGAAAVLLAKPTAPSQATSAATPTPHRAPHILPRGDAFTPAPHAPMPSGVALNAPSALHSNGAALSWPAYVNTSGTAGYDITAYQVYRNTSIYLDPSHARLVASLPPCRTSFVDATATSQHGGRYYYMVAVRTSSGVVITGTPLSVELPAAGQTQIVIPAVASGMLSAEYPNADAARVPDGISRLLVEVGSLGGPTRAVFSFGALSGALPGGAVVIEAHLSLLDTQITMLGATTDYTLYGLSHSSTAQATWNRAAPGIRWTKPGGDYATAPDGTGLPPDAADPSRCDFDATAIVRGWISDPGSEHGLLLKANHERDPHHIAYFVAAGDSIPSQQRPALVVTYRVSRSAGASTSRS